MKLSEILLPLICAVAFNTADATELTRGPEAAIYVGPKVFTGNFSGVDGDSTIGAPTWHLSQWNIPTEMVGGNRYAPNSDWQVANTYSRLKYLEAQKAYEIAENGNNAALACGVEQDLFLSPTTSAEYPGYPVDFRASSTLDQPSALLLNVGFNPTFESIYGRCSTNYAAYTFAFILSSTTSQTLFYQLILRDSRNISISKSWCPNSETKNNATFCVDDGLQTVYGLSSPVVGQGRRTFSIDVLPQMLAAIRSGHVKSGQPSQVLDSNPAHWKVTGVYFGQLIQGGAVPTSQWDSVRIEQQ